MLRIEHRAAPEEGQEGSEAGPSDSEGIPQMVAPRKWLRPISSRSTSLPRGRSGAAPPDARLPVGIAQDSLQIFALALSPFLFLDFPFCVFFLFGIKKSNFSNSAFPNKPA